MCYLNWCAQPLSQCLPLPTSKMGDTYVYFIRSMGPTVMDGGQVVGVVIGPKTTTKSTKVGGHVLRLAYWSVGP